MKAEWIKWHYKTYRWTEKPQQTVQKKILCSLFSSVSWPSCTVYSTAKHSPLLARPLAFWTKKIAKSLKIVQRHSKLYRRV